MFEVYVVSKTAQPRRWLRATIAFSVVAHAIAIAALVVASFWRIEKLEPKYVAVSFQVVAAPPAPPPPPPPPPPASAMTHTEKKIKPTALVQPPKEQQPEEKPDKPDDAGEQGGVEGGVAGGVVGGVVGGTGEGNLPPPPPPPKAPPPPPPPPRLSDAERGRLLRDYLTQKVQPSVTRHFSYPQDMQRNGIEGIVMVRLTVAADGRLLDARVVGQCVEQGLCQASVATAREASPFPPPPPILGDTVKVDVRFEYHLE